MDRHDHTRFVEVLNAVLDVYGKQRSDVAVALWWKLLERFSLAEVEEALAQHVGASKFAPTPADVITILTARDGRPTADEAWSMIPRDEQASVIWTDEMSKAYGIAAPLLGHGDQIAARRAFIDRYESEVAANRRNNVPVRSWPSWGWDAQGRAPALAKAVELGLMSPQHAAGFVAQLPDQTNLHPRIAAALEGGAQLKRIK
jgi:hypothetical protein